MLAIHKQSQETSASSKPTPLQSDAKDAKEQRLLEVSVVAEDRRRERMKSLTRNLEVCDLLDMRNLQSVAEYAPKITTFLLEEETRFMLPKSFMKDQTEGVTEKMRAYLVDWLTELHYKFKMLSETLFVTIGIVDHYLAIVTDITKQQLQCLGITALLIAGKYEEIYPPDLKTVLKVVN